MHAPLALQGADMRGFFLKGDPEKLQATVDAGLNRAAQGHATFKVLSSYVMLTFTRVGHAHSAHPSDAAKGWITETDIITWIPVGQIDDRGRLQHLYFYPAHIWVDDTMALINGRELYGYPKYDCQYDMPDAGEAGDFRLRVKGFEPFSPDTKIAWHPLLELTPHARGGLLGGLKDRAHPIRSFADLVKGAFEGLMHLPDFLIPDLAGWEDLLSLLAEPRTDQLFLKQFPDGTGGKAVYQAVVAAPAVVNAVHGGQLFGQEYSCTLHEVASFPLQETLGIALGEQPAHLPFEVRFDFTVTEATEVTPPARTAPEKIAILGGGVGAISAAYHLTQEKDWQEKYDITLYQMGWRLGGKGASGRNAASGQRIEEHGLHIWFGFYENAFRMIQGIYGELGRPDGAPLATWQDAFKPHDYIVLSEHIEDTWRPWPLMFPHRPGTPGDGDEHPMLWEAAQALLAHIKKWLADICHLHLPEPVAAPQQKAGEHDSWLHHLAKALQADVEHLAMSVVHSVEGACQLAAALPKRLHGAEDAHGVLAHTLQGIKGWIDHLLCALLDRDDEIRRAYICLDLGVTTLLGFLRDGVLKGGFDVINDIDLRDWLIKHGANERYSVNSAVIRGFYDLVFAYDGGDYDRPNAEAGTLLRAMMKIGLSYKGSIMYKMQAGMGDTIFSPAYQALRARGVKFKFFHKVEELTRDGDEVGTIRLTRQATVASGDAHYDPFVYVKGLACWPSAPNLDQLLPAEAQALRGSGANLESHWSTWPQVYEQTFGKPLPEVTLRKGVDFDRVILGVSVASVPLVAPELVAGSEALKATTEQVKTIPTQAYQLWFNQTLSELGWTSQPDGQQPVLSGFTEPYDTWAPMDQLLCREDWPDTPGAPKNVSYFCSVFPDEGLPPPSDTAFPVHCAEQAKAGALHQVRQQLTALLPAVGPAGDFNWNLLSAPDDTQGEARFDAQYWRANMDPSERYVMSVVGSSQYRLRADESGYRNLVLTGDWLKTGLNAGCVEAAVMAGIQAAQAITGVKAPIPGERDV
ncbi:NAD(P)-binding protein [Deinococcus multiflagellatus]|uniref:NAD(P)-binding protein n=1 Tax=Deinococcus multiflagellatus TaxID=1656887 RepID=A0ABW1ZG44_9DEIO|nr:NAD(P)-binding protein [Deinococcus multiflagellatus]MBZ9711729.1 NAD(P)-binding protein [Deinococcus multiflagellatus]